MLFYTTYQRKPSHSITTKSRKHKPREKRDCGNKNRCGAEPGKKKLRWHTLSRATWEVDNLRSSQLTTYRRQKTIVRDFPPRLRSSMMGYLPSFSVPSTCTMWVFLLMTEVSALDQACTLSILPHPKEKRKKTPVHQFISHSDSQQRVKYRPIPTLHAAQTTGKRITLARCQLPPMAGKVIHQRESAHVDVAITG